MPAYKVRWTGILVGCIAISIGTAVFNLWNSLKQVSLSRVDLVH